MPDLADLADLRVSPEGLTVVLGQTVVVVQPALLAGVRLPALPHQVLLLLAVVLHVLPQTAGVGVLLLAARHLALVGFLPGRRFSLETLLAGWTYRVLVSLLVFSAV